MWRIFVDEVIANALQFVDELHHAAFRRFERKQPRLQIVEPLFNSLKTTTRRFDFVELALRLPDELRDVPDAGIAWRASSLAFDNAASARSQLATKPSHVLAQIGKNILQVIDDFHHAAVCGFERHEARLQFAEFRFQLGEGDCERSRSSNGFESGR